jgi:uncharacterized protein (TIGR01244 family)
MENVVRITEDFTVAKFEPDAAGFSRIAEEGFRSVVNLQTEEEDQKIELGEERHLAEGAGLVYYHHGISKQALSDEVVDGLRAKLEKLPKPVLLHCTSGKRSGAIAMMHVASKQGMSGKQVIEKAETMGFDCDTPELEQFVKNYVDRHSQK